LTSIVIPNSVTSIGYRVFIECTNLTSITVDNANANYSSLDGVLFNKNKTTLILFPGGKGGSYTTIPNSVTSIGGYAFIGCTNLTSVVIPNSVTSIGDNAFRECTNLTSIAIPNSVTIIGYNAFYLCANLPSIAIPTSVTTIGNDAFLSSGLLTVTIANNQVISGTLFASPASGVFFFGRTVATFPF
jgi:hypothetical protein